VCCGLCADWIRFAAKILVTPHNSPDACGGATKDATDRLAQALRDLIDEVVKAAVEAAIEYQHPATPAPPPPADAERTWLSRKEVADRLRLPLKTLAEWATAGRGPMYYKIGKYARYRLSDVMAWEQKQIRG
jgi:hypothetical protein